MSKLVRVFIIVDMEGHVAKKKKKKSFRKKVQFAMSGKVILGPKSQKRKNKNDSVPSGLLSSQSLRRK